MSTDLDEQGRPEPPTTGDEAATLTGYLDFLRATIAWKTDGLSDDELHATPLPSSMSLGGLLKHLAFVEAFWFTRVLAGQEVGQPWADVDWAADADWDWHSAAEQPGDELRALWRRAVDESRFVWRETSAVDGFGLDMVAPDDPGAEPVSVRWVLTHMVEEYGRHCGHADLLREALDGSVGE